MDGFEHILKYRIASNLIRIASNLIRYKKNLYSCFLSLSLSLSLSRINETNYIYICIFDAYWFYRYFAKNMKNGIKCVTVFVGG